MLKQKLIAAALTAAFTLPKHERWAENSNRTNISADFEVFGNNNNMVILLNTLFPSRRAS